MVFGVCPHLCNAHVATHKRAVSTAVAVVVMVEENALVGFPHGDYMVAPIDFVVNVGGGVVDSLGLVVNEVFGGVLYGDVV